MLLFITICCTDFCLIVLCSSLLISFLFNSVPAPYSWCIPALHMVFLPCSRGGPQLPPSYCFVLNYPLINQIFHFSFFPSSHFAQVSALLCLVIRLLGISSITKRPPPSLSLSLSSCTDHYTPVHSTTCNSPVGWHHATETFHCPHLSLYKLCITATGFLLGSWTLTMGPKSCPKTSVRNYSYLLRNNPQEHISLLLYFGSLKSRPEELC